jgi:hypothetical protein
VDGSDRFGVGDSQPQYQVGAAEAAEQLPQHLPGIGDFDDVAQRHHRHPERGGGQPGRRQRLAAAKPARRVVRGAEQQRVDRGPVVSGAHGQGSGPAEVATRHSGLRGVIGQHRGGQAGAGRRRRAGPISQLRTDARVVGLYRRSPVRGRSQVGHLAVRQYLQVGFGSGGRGDGAQVLVGHRRLADRPPIGVPNRDGFGEPGRGLADRSLPGQGEGGQQIGLVGVG